MNNMLRIRIFFLLPTFFIGILAQSQTVERPVKFSSKLHEILDLEISNNDNTMDFIFQNTSDYNHGIALPPSKVTEVSIEATINWQLKIRSLTKQFTTAFPESGNIPLNNLGYWIHPSGRHDQKQLNIKAHSVATINKIHNTNKTCICTKPGETSVGDGTANRFQMMWEIGTMHGNMNPRSILKQMGDGTFSLGTHLLTVEMTLMADSH